MREAAKRRKQAQREKEAERLKRGTISRTRRTTGINFLITTTNTVEEESKVKKTIIDFSK